MELTQKEKEIAEDLRKYYKHLKRCGVCNRIFGSDLKYSNKICPICLGKLKKKK